MCFVEHRNKNGFLYTAWSLTSNMSFHDLFFFLFFFLLSSLSPFTLPTWTMTWLSLLPFSASPSFTPPPCLAPQRHYHPDVLAGEEALLGRSRLPHPSNPAASLLSSPASSAAGAPCLDEFGPSSMGSGQPTAGKRACSLTNSLTHSPQRASPELPPLKADYASYLPEGSGNFQNPNVSRNQTFWKVA